MKLNAKALGLSLGIIWGAAILLVTFASLLTAGSYGVKFLYGIASIYPGYSISYIGALIGLAYGFVDAFIAGWLVAVIYNFFAKEK